MSDESTTRVHRFRDSVAMSAGNGETVYISADHARKLSRALSDAAASCETEGFTESTFGNVEIKEEG